MRRRYLLEIIRKLFKWVSYPFKYLYHSIIPSSTVNKNKELPKEYQEVEYIESTGTQYIDSGFKPNQDSSVELKAKLNSFTTATPIFGSRADNNVDSFVIGISGDVGKNFYAQFDSGNRVHNYQAGDTQVHVFSLDRNYFKVDNVIRSTISDVINFSSNYNAFLFGMREGNVIARSSQQVFYCQL